MSVMISRVPLLNTLQTQTYTSGERESVGDRSIQSTIFYLFLVYRQSIDFKKLTIELL